MGIWIGIDVGTSGVRVEAYDNDGHRRAAAVSAIVPRGPEPGAMVVDAERDWWGGAVTALCRVREALGSEHVEAIGLSGLFPGHCWVDEKGQVRGEGVLYGDRRAAAHVAVVEQVLGTPLLGDEVLPRLRWSMTNAVPIPTGTRLLGPAAFVGFRLTGEVAIDPQSAYRWGGLNPRRDAWDPSVLETLGLDPAWFPPIRSSRSVLGHLTPAAGALTGLPSGLPVAVGVTDTFATLAACGVLDPGDAFLYLGASATLTKLTASLDSVLDDPAVLDADTPWRLILYVLASGTLLQTLSEIWFRRSLSSLDRMAAASPPGAEGVRVSRPPREGSVILGPEVSITGVDAGHTPGHIWRAALEAIAFELAKEQREVDGQPVVVGGGGASSEVWLRIISETTGWDLLARPTASASRGAAFVAGLALGSFNRLDEIRHRWLPSERERLITASIRR
jgi:xylulokinase